MPHFPASILVGVDGTDAGRHAAEVAAELAVATSSPLHLVHVKITRTAVTGSPAPQPTTERMRQEAEALLSTAADELRAAGISDVHTHVRFGRKVEDVLAALQDELGGGLLVLGGQRSGRVARAVLGSLPVGTVRSARGSVLVVR